VFFRKWSSNGNKPLHEWKTFESKDAITEDTITWVFDEDSFSPVAKIKGDKQYSILSDYLGTPTHVFDFEGDVIWETRLDSYGKMQLEKGKIGTCPFRYQGQYEDYETGLYYNRFRYYSPEEGGYISQDPIGLLGGNKFYNYVNNPNNYIDVLGLTSCASSNLPKLRGKSIKQIEKILKRNGYVQTKVSNSSARNQTWNHPDGSEVRIHPYGNETTTMRNGNTTPKSGLNAHVHKEDSAGNQLNDRGNISTDPNETHIGVKNPNNLPSIRNRPHGFGS
jgi:RHS repeat-associated protein